MDVVVRLITGILLLFLLASARAGSLPSTPLANSDSLVTKVDDSTYRIGAISVSSTQRFITIPGFVNQTEGPVEYLAVTSEGKRHESVLVLEANPLHVQTALLLLGFSCGQNLLFQGDTSLPQGDTLHVRLAWVKSSGKDSVEIDAAQALMNYADSGNVGDIPWIFTGSYIYNGQFVAAIEGSLIATYSDPVAILNNGASTRVDDTVYGANKAVLPAVGTRILLTISKY